MKLFTKKYHKPGTRPGMLAKQKAVQVSLELLDYNASSIQHRTDLNIEQCRQFIDKPNVTWIHVQGDPSNDTLRTLAKGLNIHELYVEDVVNTGQRPKVELSENQVFIVLSLPVDNGELVSVEQVSLFLTENTVVSFCTGTFNPFSPIVDRLNKGLGKLRKLNADYLLYNLADAVIDFGYPLLETYSEKIQSLEDSLLQFSDEKVLAQVHKLRRELLLLRRKLWPQREVINEIIRDDECLVLSSETKLHFRDCHDHVISIMELLETYHEMTSGLMELYMTSVSLKLNDVMKVLTIIATIFIPPTFIVGVYGMNFDPQVNPLNMPELEWQYGYLAVWVLIALMISGMLLFFRKQKWI
ncbi:magnesium/cobalt transporter CorA [Aliiglaciecola sp. LCG003]|uniref:magnesium/cobalt transporter CorA n=1 Tax=Aliiglaciecola sp. LCG003 TaxID=3053655 RepID=UPI00257240E1|nr:magnesium/cobalt transporter CorA [Aliiglaciecola sp. LCG003]WJG07638.1 magnesium/cobalt transporter CorA [Aliiglaciecola sp. LCG003]